MHPNKCITVELGGFRMRSSSPVPYFALAIRPKPNSLRSFHMSIVMEDSEEITVDIFFGGLGKEGQAVTTTAQTALLDAFKAAGNINDLAARLGIPIQLLAVTGVKAVSTYGYDGYKISIAIKSDDPNAVAKELFTTAMGKVVGAGLTASPMNESASSPTWASCSRQRTRSTVAQAPCGSAATAATPMKWPGARRAKRSGIRIGATASQGKSMRG